MSDARPDGPPPPPAGGADSGTRPAPRRGPRWALWVPWLAMAVLAGLIVAPLLPPLALPLLATEGRIYVESPEVYTRERLVNDRYRQDFWLKSQLDLLDESGNLISAIERSRLAIGPGGEGPAPPEIEDVAIAFREQFLLRAAMRDKIRQLILENLLDDRHDLTGNSLYGLKFDTGIVPGTNTHLRPYVNVRLILNDIDPAGIDELLDSRGFLDDQTVVDPPESLTTAERQFRNWERNLEARLNRFLNDRWAAMAGGRRASCADPATRDLQAKLDQGPRPAAAADGDLATAALAPPAPTLPDRAMAEDIIRQALGNVLGLATGGVAIAWPRPGEDARENALPEPWGRYFRLVLREFRGGAETGRGAPFALDLLPFDVDLYVVNLKDWNAFLNAVPLEVRLNYWRVRAFRWAGADEFQPADKVLLVRAETLTAQDGAPQFTPRARDLTFARSLGLGDVERLRRWAAAPGCLMPNIDDGGCWLSGERFKINAPLYDFVRARKRSDTYSYAVFPRGDVEGILSDRAQSAETPVPPGAESLPTLSAAVRRLEARAEPIVVNIVKHSPAPNQIEFGWVVARTGQQSPRQLSQLVLVSVPAYLEELRLEIETGWLDRNSRETAVSDPSTVYVSLPPDFEALDRVVVGGSLSEGPVIDQYHFTEGCSASTVVRACQPADLLIPGVRLWRSTTVTLGGQLAEQITVTPDMRGIVASFRPVAWPPDLPPGETSATSLLPLVVWTSEGADSLDVPVTVLPPADPAMGMDCRRPQPAASP